MEEESRRSLLVAFFGARTWSCLAICHRKMRFAKRNDSAALLASTCVFRFSYWSQFAIFCEPFSVYKLFSVHTEERAAV